jgi:hypothetical protein
MAHFFEFRSLEKVTMAPLRCGRGAKCSVLKKNLHPKKRISDTYVNHAVGDRLDGLVALRREKKSIRKKEAECTVFHHADFPNEEIYCVNRWVKVSEEGPPSEMFEDVVMEPAESEDGEAEDDPDIPEELFNRNRGRNGHREDIAAFRSAGFDVDDDNEPAPENLPEANTNATQDTARQWGWSGICRRQAQSLTDSPAHLNGFSGERLQSITFLSMFLLFLPKKFIMEVLIVQTNAALEQRAGTLESSWFGLVFGCSCRRPKDLRGPTSGP